MTVTPAVNETSFFEIEKKIRKAADFGALWIHLDVSDGKFTKNTLWNNPADLLNINDKLSNIKIEVHLMVENPDEVFENWIDAGAQRVILHLEAIKDLEVIKEKCANSGVELFIAGNPDTLVDKFLAYKGMVDGFLVLAVNPGLAGQKFQEDQLEKIKVLRQTFPDTKIEADGGVNADNTKAIKDAGADILVSASYIWNSKSPKQAYLDLLNI